MDETLMRPLDGANLTTADLEFILETMPQLLSAAGVLPSTMDMVITRKSDLYFLAEHSPLDQIVSVIAASGSGVAFVRQTEFDAASLLEDVEGDVLDEDEEFPSAVENVLEDALTRQGEISQVTLTWSLNGLLCTWQADAAWALGLGSDFAAALVSVAGVDLEVKQEQDEALQQDIAKVVDAVIADPAYRGTLPQKRRGTVDSVLKGMVIDDAVRNAIWLTVRISQQTEVEGADRAFDVHSRMDELAAALAETADWAAAKSIANKKVLTNDFLLREYDGWRMPNSIVEELRVAATKLAS
ncbi:hypothetical protein [Specibacter sp. RAF43]|uniref:hypothetical protein n=1 Tax=Specibacter sp. RAF43 TaxID=3233057 RepID=UPI003F9849D3